MKALVIGACGFAGKYMCQELLCNDYDVAAADISSDNGAVIIDITDYNSVFNVIKDVSPDIIFNLAGYASVALSWKNPQKTMDINVNGTINILEAVRNLSISPRIVLIGSSEEYGTADFNEMYVDESHPLNPVSPYAISKRCQEDIGLSYHKTYNMDILFTRSFNHIGPGQKTGFVVSDFAYGISEIEKGRQSFLQTGNLSSSRCFTDVRDVVRAYRLIGESGASGKIYNVGSSAMYKIEEILDILVKYASCEITVKTAQDKLRRFDTPCWICNSGALKQDTAWEPAYNIEETLLEILNYYRNND